MWGWWWYWILPSFTDQEPEAQEVRTRPPSYIQQRAKSGCKSSKWTLNHELITEAASGLRSCGLYNEGLGGYRGGLLKRKNVTWQIEHNLKISSRPERGWLWATHSYTVSDSFNVIFKWEGTHMLVLHLKINNNEMKIKETWGRLESLYYEPRNGRSTCFLEVWGCGFPNRAKKWFWDDFHWAGSRLSGQENFYFFCVAHVGFWL